MIVAFTGKAHAGKSTAATAVAEAFGLRRLAFADPLKDDAVRLIQQYDPTFTREALDRNKQAYRPLLQALGTTVRDTVRPDYWVDRLVGRIRAEEKSAQAGAGYVIDDLRFPNEAEAIHRLGGVVVRVETPYNTRQQRLGLDNAAMEKSDGHASERAVDSVPYDFLLFGDVDTSYNRAYLTAVLAREKAVDTDSTGDNQ